MSDLRLREKLLKYVYMSHTGDDRERIHFTIGYLAYAILFNEEAADNASNDELNRMATLIIDTGSFRYDKETEWMCYDGRGRLSGIDA